jgi:hypothetical protein
MREGDKMGTKAALDPNKWASISPPVGLYIRACIWRIKWPRGWQDKVGGLVGVRWMPVVQQSDRERPDASSNPSASKGGAPIDFHAKKLIESGSGAWSVSHSQPREAKLQQHHECSCSACVSKSGLIFSLSCRKWRGRARERQAGSNKLRPHRGRLLEFLLNQKPLEAPTISRRLRTPF